MDVLGGIKKMIGVATLGAGSAMPGTRWLVIALMVLIGAFVVSGLVMDWVAFLATPDKAAYIKNGKPFHKVLLEVVFTRKK